MCVVVLVVVVVLLLVVVVVVVCVCVCVWVWGVCVCVCVLNHESGVLTAEPSSATRQQHALSISLPALVSFPEISDYHVMIMSYGLSFS